MSTHDLLSVTGLNPFKHTCGGSRLDMFAKPKGLYGTTNSSGKMSSTVNHLSNAVIIKGYGKAEVLMITRDVNNIHDTHQVVVQLTNPLVVGADECVNETHLVTSRFLSAFDDIRYQA